jgi:hypothetical protein
MLAINRAGEDCRVLPDGSVGPQSFSLAGTLSRCQYYRACSPPSAAQLSGFCSTVDASSAVQAVSQKRKGCGAQHKTGQEPFRAALRFARVP